MVKKQKLNQELLNQFVSDFVEDNGYFKNSSKNLKNSGEIIHLTGYQACIQDMLNYSKGYNNLIEQTEIVIEKIDNLGDE